MSSQMLIVKIHQNRIMSGIKQCCEHIYADFNNRFDQLVTQLLREWVAKTESEAGTCTDNSVTVNYWKNNSLTFTHQAAAEFLQT